MSCLLKQNSKETLLVQDLAGWLEGRWGGSEKKSRFFLWPGTDLPSSTTDEHGKNDDSCQQKNLMSKPDFNNFKTIALDPSANSEPDPSWNILRNGTALLQSLNSSPGLAVGRDNLEGIDFEGSLFVDTMSDVGYIGFVSVTRTTANFTSLCGRSQDKFIGRIPLSQQQQQPEFSSSWWTLFMVLAIGWGTVCGTQEIPRTMWNCSGRIPNSRVGNIR